MKLPSLAAAALLAVLLSTGAHAEGGFTGSSVIASAPRPANAGPVAAAEPDAAEPGRGGALWFPFAQVADQLASPRAAAAPAPEPVPSGMLRALEALLLALSVSAAAWLILRAARRQG